MSFDMEAYKLARIREAETEAREDLARSVAELHVKLDALMAMFARQTPNKKD